MSRDEAKGMFPVMFWIVILSGSEEPQSETHNNMFQPLWRYVYLTPIWKLEPHHLGLKYRWLESVIQTRRIADHLHSNISCSGISRHGIQFFTKIAVWTKRFSVWSPGSKMFQEAHGMPQALCISVPPGLDASFRDRNAVTLDYDIRGLTAREPWNPRTSLCRLFPR